MDELKCDICLLGETMTCRVKVEGFKSITSQRSVGQNVCILMKNSLIGPPDPWDERSYRISPVS